MLLSTEVGLILEIWRYMKVMGFRLTGNFMVMESPHTGPSNFRNSDPFITRIHWWPVDSLHTGPAISSVLQNDKSHIAVTSHGRHGFSTHWDIYCLLNSSWNPPGTDRNTAHLATPPAIGKTPVRIILWCPITKMLIKGCFLIQPLEQEGWCQKCSISLCSKVFLNHFYQMKASPECLNILTYWINIG